MANYSRTKFKETVAKKNEYEQLLKELIFDALRGEHETRADLAVMAGIGRATLNRWMYRMEEERNIKLPDRPNAPD